MMLFTLNLRHCEGGGNCPQAVNKFHLQQPPQKKPRRQCSEGLETWLPFHYSVDGLGHPCKKTVTTCAFCWSGVQNSRWKFSIGFLFTRQKAYGDGNYTMIYHDSYLYIFILYVYKSTQKNEFATLANWNQTWQFCTELVDASKAPTSSHHWVPLLALWVSPQMCQRRTNLQHFCRSSVRLQQLQHQNMKRRHFETLLEWPLKLSAQHHDVTVITAESQ